LNLTDERQIEGYLFKVFNIFNLYFSLDLIKPKPVFAEKCYALIIFINVIEVLTTKDSV